MKAILSVLLLVSSVAHAGNEFSQPQSDWQKSIRDSRRAAAQNRYHAPAGVKPSKIVFNEDGSITFTKPLIVRGPKFFPISSSYSDPDGVCAVFGMDYFLPDTLEGQPLNPQTMVSIDETGHYSSQGAWTNAVDSITCAYRGAQYDTGTFREVYENADGSVTLIQPVFLRGDKPMAISSSYSDSEGVCRLFGFDEFLPDSLETAALNPQSMVSVDETGRYSAKGTWTNAVSAISCYMKGDLQQTGFARKIQRNLDRSVTIYNPVLLRGMEGLPLSSSYSDTTGICNLFGFKNLLEDSLETQARNPQRMASIDEYGSYGSGGTWTNAVSSITCYNGRYRTTALAGGVVFQDGVALGKVRRAHSRWIVQPVPGSAMPQAPMIMPPKN